MMLFALLFVTVALVLQQPCMFAAARSIERAEPAARTDFQSLLHEKFPALPNAHSDEVDTNPENRVGKLRAEVLAARGAVNVGQRSDGGTKLLNSEPSRASSDAGESRTLSKPDPLKPSHTNRDEPHTGRQAAAPTPSPQRLLENNNHNLRPDEVEGARVAGIENDIQNAQRERTVVIKILFDGADADEARLSTLAARVACAALLNIPSSKISLEVAGPNTHQFLLISVIVPRGDVGRVTAAMHSPLIVASIEHMLQKSMPTLSLALAATSVFPHHTDTANNTPDEAHVGSSASAAAALITGVTMLLIVLAAALVVVYRLHQHGKVRHSSEIDESEPILQFDDDEEEEEIYEDDLWSDESSDVQSSLFKEESEEKLTHRSHVGLPHNEMHAHTNTKVSHSTDSSLDHHSPALLGFGIGPVVADGAL